MAPPKKTLYQILGVPRDASPEDIGLAYEMRSAELQRAVPPDPSGLALVHEAHSILGDPHRREAYDASLVTAAERAEAAAQTQLHAPDLELEDGDSGDGRRKRKLVLMIAGMAFVMFALFMAFRPRGPGKPMQPPPAPVAEAPKPAPPAPPRPRTGPEVLAAATASGGQVLAYSMSGSGTPIGMALGTDASTMVTTCHGIPAGAKLVVRVGAVQHPADLTITDEELDLCRLSVAGFTAPPLRMADEEPRAGDPIFAVGMNARGEMAATEGKITQLRPTPRGNVLEISVPIAPTASGGGVFDIQGRLVGIATTSPKFGAGAPIALPTAWLAEMRSRSRPQ